WWGLTAPFGHASAGLRPGRDRPARLDPRERAAGDVGDAVAACGEELAGLLAAPAGAADDVHQLVRGHLVGPLGKLREGDEHRPGDVGLRELVRHADVQDGPARLHGSGELVDGDLRNCGLGLHVARLPGRGPQPRTGPAAQPPASTTPPYTCAPPRAVPWSATASRRSATNASATLSCPGDAMTWSPPCWRSRFQPRSSMTSPTASMSTRTSESGSGPNSNTDMSGSEVIRRPSIERTPSMNVVVASSTRDARRR